MRTRFQIEKRKDAAGNLLSADRPVFMSVTFGGNRVIIGTGIKVDMNGWDADLQKIQVAYPGAQGFNNWLESMQDIAKQWRHCNIRVRSLVLKIFDNCISA